jgi:hypothetical protein
MGTYAGFAGVRAWDELRLQIVYSALKVPLLLAATCLVSLPSFFVINTLAGLRDDFFEAVRAVAAAQAGVSIILASLAPLTLTWYASSVRYGNAVLFNAAMFGLAGITAQQLLRTYYRPLVARRPRHRLMMWCWLAIYAFVGIQMGWMMRPFVGSPGDPVVFMRHEPDDNAYVVVVRLIGRALSL